jgi:ATP-binding cassette subfamily B protein
MEPMSMMGHGGGWATMRSYTRDRSAFERQLPKGIWRRILGFARAYRWWLAVFLLLILLDAVIGAVNPLIYRAIIDRGIGTHPPAGSHPGLIVALAGFIAGLALLDAGIALVQRWYSARIGEGLIYDMRSAVFAHVQRMPIAFFTRTQTGALISRLNNDVLGAQQAFTDVFGNVISNVVSVVLVLVFMLFLSWQITLLALVLLPVFVIPARLIGRRLQVITREAYTLNAEMNTTMTERFNVAGALLVKLFGRLPEEDAGFRGRARRVADIGVARAMYAQVFFVALTLVAALATALVYGLGGRLAVDRVLQVGTVVAMVAYLNRLYGPLTALSNVRVDIATALVSFDRIFEVLDLEPMIKDRPGAVALPPLAGRASLEFDGVDFRYPTAEEVSLASLEVVATLDAAPDRQVLHGVSFRAEPGQLVALVGPSGAGKTTISQLVTRMYDVQAGAVRVGGYDVRDVTLDSLRAQIGVVTQDAHMFHDTIRANLRYARPAATEDQLWAACDAAQIGELVRSLPDGLDTVVGDRGYRLSGGEKQRVAIARLLLKAPAVVVLDEATAHLDSESEAAVQRALTEALTGRTSLVIAHRLSTVRQADQILVIEDGRVVQSGRHEELIGRGGLYAELYETQFAAPGAAAGPDGWPAVAAPPGGVPEPAAPAELVRDGRAGPPL